MKDRDSLYGTTFEAVRTVAAIITVTLQIFIAAKILL